MSYQRFLLTLRMTIIFFIVIETSSISNGFQTSQISNDFQTLGIFGSFQTPYISYRFQTLSIFSCFQTSITSNNFLIKKCDFFYKKLFNPTILKLKFITFSCRKKIDI